MISHDNHHHLGALHLSAVWLRVMYIWGMRSGRRTNQRDEVRQRSTETVGKGLGRRSDEVRQDVEEGEALLSRIREIVTRVAQKVEQRDQDGHLDQQGQAAAKGVELVLIELLQLLGLTR